MSTISKPALKRLCTLYSQFESRSFDTFNRSIAQKRNDRLVWASTCLSRPIASFSDLTAGDAKHLTDNLQLALGIGETSPPKRRPKSRRESEKLGTEGRSDQLHADVTILAGDEEVLQKVKHQMSELGWDQDGLRRFLRSRIGPNNGREVLRTLGDANRVYWALKNIIQRHRTRAAHPAAQLPAHEREVLA